MNLQITTEHQDKVLNILRSGGVIIQYWDNGVWKAQLNTSNENTLTIRKDTIDRLVEIGFIKCFYDHPAIDVNTYNITKLGISWLVSNKISPSYDYQ